MEATSMEAPVEASTSMKASVETSASMKASVEAHGTSMGARGTSRRNSFPRRDASVESAVQTSATFAETGSDLLSAEASMVASST